MPQTINIAELNISNDKLLSSLSATKKEIDSLSESQKLLKKAGETSSQTFVEQEAKLKALKSEYSSQQKVLQAQTQASTNLNNALQREITTLDGAKANNAELRASRNQLNSSTVEGVKAIEEINKKIDQNTKYIETNVDGFEKQKMQIGDYRNQITGALNDINPLNGGIAGLSQRSKEAGGAGALLSKSLKGVTSGIWGATKASLAFLATPIGVVVGAIGIALGAVVGYLKSTQAGMDKVTAVTRPLSAIFQSLIGVLQDVGKFFYEAFTNPKEALEDVYNYVKDKVIKQFKAFGKVLEGVFTLDFSLVKEGFKDLANNAKDVINDIGEAGKQAGKFFSDAIEKGKEIDRLTKEIEQGENNLILLRAENLKKIKEQELIAKDTTKSAKERNEATQEAIRLSNELAQAEQNLLDKKIQQKEIEFSLNDTSRADEKELNELRAERVKKDEEADARKMRFLGTLNSIQKENQKKAIEAVNEAIKKQEVELKLFVEKQGFKKKSLEEELKLQQETSKKEIEILDAKLKAKKITEEEYELERLRIKNEQLQKESEITIQNAQLELDAYIKNNQAKIDKDKYFSDEALKIEQERLNGLAEQRRLFEQKRLEEGVISQTEYNEAINAINDENRIALEEAEAEREEAKKEKEAEDLENKRILDEENFINQFELQKARLEQQRLAEVSKAEKTGADITLINKKYALAQKQIEDAKNKSQLASSKKLFGDIATLLGEHTAAGKAAGIAQATINTYQGVTEVWKAPSILPEPFNTASKVAGTAVTLASGLQAVRKITSTDAKFAQGGILNGASHSQGGIKTPFGELEGGEAVINKRSTAMFAPLLSQLNVAGGGRKFANGGILGATQIPKTMIDYDTLALKVAQANQSLPNPIVSVAEINNVSDGISAIEQIASF